VRLPASLGASLRGRWPRRVVRMAVAALLLAAVGWAAARLLPAVGLWPRVQPADPSSEARGVTRDLDLWEIPDFNLKKAWTVTIPSEASVSLAPSGDKMAVTRWFPYGDWRRLGFSVISDAGKILWEKQYPDARMRYGVAAFGLDGLIHVPALCLDETGMLYAFDASGREIYAVPIEGEQQVVSTDRADRLGIVRLRRNRFAVLDALGRELTWRDLPLSPLVTTTAGSGKFAVLGASSALLCDLDGRMTGHATIDGRPKDIAVSRDGSTFAVSVDGAAPHVALYRADGTRLWRTSLDGEGKKTLAFSADGRTLVVFDSGLRSGIVTFDTKTGEMRWRVFFQPPIGRQVVIRGGTLLPDGGGLLVDYVEAYRQNDYVEEHHLIFFSMSGKALLRSRLGSNVDVQVGSSGAFMVTCTNNLMDLGGEIRNSISYFSMQAFLEAGRR
jgi:outer membrane protein assembly factor BamB